MYLRLDGPSLQGSASVNSASVFRVRVGAAEMPERDVVSIQPLDGKIWVYFGDGVNVPSASDVKSKGFPQPKGGMRTYEATNTQEIYIVSDAGTVDVRFAERG